MSGYNTNLAADFYVLSILHRLGAEATLTLGNKKSIDIVVTRKAGEGYPFEPGWRIYDPVCCESGFAKLSAKGPQRSNATVPAS